MIEFIFLSIDCLLHNHLFIHYISFIMFTLIIPKWTDVTITVDGPYEAAYSAARGLNQLKNLTVLIRDEQGRTRTQFKSHPA